MKSKVKWVALGGLVLSFLSISVHLFLAKSSAILAQYRAATAFTEDLSYLDSAGRKVRELLRCNCIWWSMWVVFSFSKFGYILWMLVKGPGHRRLWGVVKSLEPIKPYSKPRSTWHSGNVTDLWKQELHMLWICDSVLFDVLMDYYYDAAWLLAFNGCSIIPLHSYI